MKGITDFVNIIALLVIGYLKSIRSTTEVYVCESDNVKILGKYSIGKERIDGVATYTNSNEISMYRSRGFWYIGDLEVWPPKTLYRCVEPEGCNYALDLPPVSDDGNWKAAKKSEQGTNSVVVSISPCNDNNFTSEEL